MKPLELYLFERTRDRGVLVKTVVLILLAGVILSTLVGLVRHQPATESYSLRHPSDEQLGAWALGHWKDLMDDSEIGFSDFLEEMPPLIADMAGARLEEARSDLETRRLPDEEKAIALQVFDSLAGEKIELVHELKELAEAEPPVRYAQQGMGLVLYETGEYVQAARAYEREGLALGADDAREIAVSIYSEQNRLSDLARLSTDPAYAKLIDHGIRMRLAAQKRDWVKVWENLIPAQYESIHPTILLLAILSGVIWLTILCRLLQLDTLRSSSFLLCLAAFGLGLISTWPTVFVYTWMEEVWGFTEGKDFVSSLVFYIFGVGLTEESIKLLFFAPLIPILLRRDNELEILLVAGCTGLGFAAEENIWYFGDATNSMASRFVTANFFHISATALCGLALCRALSHPQGHGGEFLRWFGGIVVIHGLYDVLQGNIPGLGDAQYGAMACYIYLCYKFFGQIHLVRPYHPRIIGLNFIFLAGLSTLVALAMIDLSFSYGFQNAMSSMVVELTGVCILSYLFVREFSKN